MVEKLHFIVHGDFVTDMAREWYYHELRGYEKAEELLTSCLCGAGLSEEEKQKLAWDILIGKTKMSGDSGEGLFLEDDDYNPYPILAKYKDDIIFDARYAAIKRKESIDKAKEAAEEALIERKLSDYTVRISDILDYEDEYGYVDKDGKLTKVSYANHSQYAYDYINEKGLDDHYDSWCRTDEKRNSIYAPTDYMVYELGFILLHNPSRGIVQAHQPNRITKAQREYLFDMYIRIAMPEMANNLY